MKLEHLLIKKPKTVFTHEVREERFLQHSNRFYSKSGMLLLLLSHVSCVRLCATPQMVAHQAPLSLGFSRQEYWSGVPLPSPISNLEMV